MLTRTVLQKCYVYVWNSSFILFTVITLKWSWNTCSISGSHYILQNLVYIIFEMGRKTNIFIHNMSTIPETNFQICLFKYTKKSAFWQFFGVMRWTQCTTPSLDLYTKRYLGLVIYIIYIYIYAADPCKTYNNIMSGMATSWQLNRLKLK